MVLAAKDSVLAAPMVCVRPFLIQPLIAYKAKALPPEYREKSIPMPKFETVKDLPYLTINDESIIIDNEYVREISLKDEYINIELK